MRYRPRRLRSSQSIRALVKETTLHVEDFVYPVFVKAALNVKEEINSLSGCYHARAGADIVITYFAKDRARLLA